MAKVFCFSSTGNSLYISKVIAEKVNGSVVSMTTAVNSCDDDIIGFVFPTYFWGLPKTVHKFISNININNKNAYIFAVTTYGSYSLGVLGAVDKLLEQKNIGLSYGAGIKSVENYIIYFEVNDSDDLHKLVDKKLDIIADEITHKKSRKVAKYTIINKIVYSMFPAKNANCDKNFTVSDSCNNCGICKKVCPSNNIDYMNSKPVFLHNCEHCLACIHACPTYAILWKNSTIHKKRYLNPNIKLKELSEFNS